MVITAKLLVAILALVFYLLAFLNVQAPRGVNWFAGAVGLSFLFFIMV